MDIRSRLSSLLERSLFHENYLPAYANAKFPTKTAKINHEKSCSKNVHCISPIPLNIQGRKMTAHRAETGLLNLLHIALSLSRLHLFGALIQLHTYSAATRVTAAAPTRDSSGIIQEACRIDKSLTFAGDL